MLLNLNRARQYGKTTTLFALENYLKDDYVVVDLDFQDVGFDSFVNEGEFSRTLSRIMLKTALNCEMVLPAQAEAGFQSLADRYPADGKLDELLSVFSDWCKCADKPLVLLIDEVDSASNNQVFLDFLAQLRMQYLEKQKDESYPAFQGTDKIR